MSAALLIVAMVEGAIILGGVLWYCRKASQDDYDPGGYGNSGFPGQQPRPQPGYPPQGYPPF